MGKIIAVVVMVLGLAACSGYNDERGRGDAPVGERDDSSATIINFPDQFMNVAFKCHGPDGVYTHTREGPPVVIPDDGNCRSEG